MEIRPIQIPRSVIKNIPPPAIRSSTAPVVRGLEVPIIDVPTPVLNYPTIDVPTNEQFQGEMDQVQSQEDNSPNPPSRALPTPQVTPDVPEPPAATVTLPVVGSVDLPPVAPLITAGATAVVTTTVVLASNIVLGQVKQALDGPLKKLLEPKKKKVKLKQKNPVLHYVRDGDMVTIFEYSAKGTKLVTTVDQPEQYIRDQVEMSSLYEYDNKVIINDDIQDMFTKEGQKRFKKHFTPAKTIVKKLSAKLAF